MLDKKVPYIILFFYIVYFAQAYFVLFNAFSTLFLLGAIIICIYYMVKSFLIKRRVPLTLKALSLITVSYCFSFFIAKNSTLALTILKDFILANFVIFPFFYLTKNGKIDIKFFKNAFVVLFIYFIFDYFVSQNRLLMQSTMATQDVVNNSGYNFVCLLPYVFFFNRKYLKLILIGIITAFVIYSAKRGAIITLLPCLGFSYVIIYKDFKSLRHKFYHIIILLLTIVIGIKILLFFLSEQSFLHERLQGLIEGDYSGRNNLLEKCWYGFWNSGGWLDYIFGYGLGETWHFSGNYAHNDWMELLVNNGFIGLCLLFFFYLGIFLRIKNIKISQNRYLGWVIFSALFFRTMFSMSFADPMSFPLIMLIGYFLGLQYQRKKTIKSSI